MGYGIAICALAMVAQVPEPTQKQDSKNQRAKAISGRMGDAHRLLRNGRYAEAEEALAAIEADAKKAPGGVTPALAVELALEKAECQAGQGEYSKAISGLQSALAAG